MQDAVVYEKPMMSSYLFAAWMHCVYLSSVRLVPVYFVGLLIFLLLETYTLHSRNMASHLGYAPVTLKEIFMALVNDEQSNYIEPLLTTKRLKTCRRDSDIEIEAHDHREFPFSERNAYPKLSVEESVVRRQNSVYKRDRKEGEYPYRIYMNFSKMQTANILPVEINLVGRLSIYAKQGQCVDQIADEMKRATSSMSTLSVASMDEAVIEDEGSDEEVEMSGDHDLQEMAREHSEDLDGSNELQYLGMFNSAARRIPLGPPQDASKKPPRNIPPQVHLARVEDVLNTITRSISMDRVYNSTLSVRPHNDVNRNSSGGRDDDEEESNNAETTSKRRRRQPLDDFDKRLGLRRRHPNPVAEITSSFLGPLMRIFRIICISVRVLFNISVWKDPYMSFWALCFLVAIMIILIFFPWRLFLFIVGLIALGPQVSLLCSLTFLSLICLLSYFWFNRTFFSVNIFTICGN